MSEKFWTWCVNTVCLTLVICTIVISAAIAVA